jgi:hypothetical protein
MTKKQIMAGNRLIAEFIGGVVNEAWRVENNTTLAWRGKQAKEFREKFKMPPGESILLEQVLFHSSWDWLMEVVGVIERVELSKDHNPVVTIENSYCVISDNGESPISESQIGDRKECTYDAVIDFIKWYNKRDE